MNEAKKFTAVWEARMPCRGGGLGGEWGIDPVRAHMGGQCLLSMGPTSNISK